MRIHIKKLLILLATAAAMLAVGPAGNAPAHADGQWPPCPYPATGLQVRVQPVIGEAVGFKCTYPMEAGRQHMVTEYGGYFTGGSNNSLDLGNGAKFGPRLGIGMSIWSQSWRCPNENYIAAPPNGIGLWKNELSWKGVKCPAVELAPIGIVNHAPWPPTDPDIVWVQNTIMPPGTPDPAAVPVDPNAQPHEPDPGPPGGLPGELLRPAPLSPINQPGA